MAQFKWLGGVFSLTGLTKTGGASDYDTLTDDSASTYFKVDTSTRSIKLSGFNDGLAEVPPYDTESQVNLYIKAKYGSSSYRTIKFIITDYNGGTPVQSFSKTITTSLAATATVYSIALTGTALTNFNTALASTQLMQYSFQVPRRSVIYEAYILLGETKISMGLEMGCSF